MYSTNKLQLRYQNVGIPDSQVTKLLSYQIVSYKIISYLIVSYQNVNYEFFSYQKSVNHNAI